MQSGGDAGGCPGGLGGLGEGGGEGDTPVHELVHTSRCIECVYAYGVLDGSQQMPDAGVLLLASAGHSTNVVTLYSSRHFMATSYANVLPAGTLMIS